jgi:hypothetical protein
MSPSVYCFVDQAQYCMIWAGPAVCDACFDKLRFACCVSFKPVSYHHHSWQRYHIISFVLLTQHIPPEDV